MVILPSELIGKTITDAYFDRDQKFGPDHLVIEFTDGTKVHVGLQRSEDEFGNNCYSHEGEIRKV